ncbi:MULTISPECIES: hypothetical protein [Arthrobacter]|uniref:Uncharacterized protein n=2 Tax=Arthrobacter TaxID=1663 RepID=A0ABU9KHV5_9MICC|nr:hypothetical protein [Arthrobacter sp. YJM1]MDP5226140.1 hypothetical protein [Arthrobacter sp. YJM1]
MANAKRGARDDGGAQAEQALRGKVRRALDAVTPAFVAWFQENEEPVGEWNAAAVLDVVQDLVVAGADGSGDISVTAFRPDEFVAAYDALAGSVAENRELLDFLGASMHSYLDFLETTGAWSGDPEDLAALQG